MQSNTEATTDIPDISTIERFRDGDRDPVARVWFDNGGAIQFREQNGQVNEEYILPNDPDSIYESYPLGNAETCSIYEYLVTLLDDLEDYDSVEALDQDMPAAMLETFGVEVV